MLATIQAFLLKWGLELLVGLIGFLSLIFRKEIVEFWKYKQNIKKDAYLKEVYGKIDKEKKASIQADKEILAAMNTADTAIKNQMAELKKDLMSILEPLREAILSSHFDTLIQKCEEYVLRGWITPEEYDRIELDYKTYKSLGGNGHMDDWMKKVRSLQIKNKEEQ